MKHYIIDAQTLCIDCLNRSSSNVKQNVIMKQIASKHAWTENIAKTRLPLESN